MCAIDDGDLCTIWRETTPRAAKPYKCAECGREIAPGEKYKRIDCLFEGSWDYAHICAHCGVMADWLGKECGGWVLRGVLDDFREHANDYRWPDLYRLIVGVKRKWQRFDGEALMPIPKLPTLSTELTP